MIVVISDKISANLKKIRNKKGYSLEEVARLADLSLNTVAKIGGAVNQNPIIETLTRIAKALGGQR
jgi:transcriptional regulator with XRE-family HTH domain